MPGQNNLVMGAKPAIILATMMVRANQIFDQTTLLFATLSPPRIMSENG